MIIARAAGCFSPRFSTALRMGLHSEHESNDTRRGEWRSNGRAAAARGLLRILPNSRRAPRRTARKGARCWFSMEENGARWIERAGRREQQGASMEGADLAMACSCSQLCAEPRPRGRAEARDQPGRRPWRRSSCALAVLWGREKEQRRRAMAASSRESRARGKNGAAVKWSSRSWHRSSAWRKEPRGRREADHGRRSCCSCGKGQREEGDRLEQHAMGVAAGRWRHGQGAPASMGKKVLLHCALTRACSRKGRRGGAMGEARLPDGCCCREEEAGRERVAAGKNGGVGVKNCQFARERAPIYRSNPRVRVS
jgi:hypothetical protein